ncbi:hypothetical protein EV121DRAFT_199598 [Schizophyllum commune]
MGFGDDRHRDRAACGRTRMCEPRLFFATYAPKHKTLSSKIINALLRKLSHSNSIDPVTQEWTALPMPRRRPISDDVSGPAHKKEKNHFEDLGLVVQQILSAAEEVLPDRYSPDKRTTDFICRPYRMFYSEPDGSWTSIGCLFVRKQTSYPPDIDIEKQPQVMVKGAGRHIYAADLTAIGELKDDTSINDKLDNEIRVCTHPALLFWNSDDRIGVFSFTIERSKLRIWYHTRSHSAVTTEIDIYEDKRWFIEFVLFSTYASLPELGFDPTVRLVLDENRDLQYQFDLYASETARKPITYQTTGRLSNDYNQLVYCKATHVYEVRLVIKNSDDPKKRLLAEEKNVLRDCWVHDEVADELDIQRDIQQRMMKLPAAWKKAEKHFMTIQHDGIVRFPAAHGNVDCTVPGAPSDSEHFPYVGAPSFCWTTPPLPRLDLKKRCRTVYKHRCVELLDIDDPALFFHAMTEVVQILHSFKLIGAIHGDVSPRNFLLRQLSRSLLDLASPVTRASLDDWVTIVSDLENSRQYKDSSGHDPIVGTPFFTAIEVQARQYEHTNGGPRIDLRSLRDTQYKSEDDPCRNFAFNPYHDLESALWMAIHFVIFKMPKSILSGDAARAEEAASVLRKYANVLFTYAIDGSRSRTLHMKDMRLTQALFDALHKIDGKSPVPNIIVLIQSLRDACAKLEKHDARTLWLPNGRCIFHPDLFKDDIYTEFEQTFREIRDYYFDHPEMFVDVPPYTPRSKPTVSATPLRELRPRKRGKVKHRASPATSDEDGDEIVAASKPSAAARNTRGRKRAAPKNKSERPSGKRRRMDMERQEDHQPRRRSSRIREQQARQKSGAGR